MKKIIFKIIAVIAFFCATFAIGYFIYSEKPDSNGTITQACATSQEKMEVLKTLNKGEIAALGVLDTPRQLNNIIKFLDSNGQTTSLSELGAKKYLVNIWASWCAPCKKEMPFLNSLQSFHDKDDFEVVAISIDTEKPEKARQFLVDHKIDNLTFYSEPTFSLYQELRKIGRGTGVPVTMLIDETGCEIAFLPGIADWSSKDAFEFLKKWIYE